MARFKIVNGTSVQFTPAEETARDAEEAAFVVSRRRRTIFAIYTDINALTSPQKGTIWTNINSGTPQKFFTSKGANDGVIATMFWIVSFSGVGATGLLTAQVMLIAMYCQDNPAYLVNPSFAPTINIAGDEPAT